MLNRTNLPYTPAGRLCSKLQDYTGTGNIYAYSPNSKQHAVRRIYNGLTNELYNLRWDNNGNLAQQTVYSVANNATTYKGMRYLQWDEDDRLNLVAGDGYLSYYAYGHDGNRAIKMTGNAAIDQTGTLLNSTNLENITLYPNEYLAVTQAEYTKYYYAGGNRIASKIGTGGFGKMQRLCTQDLNLSANANTLFGNALQQIVNITNQPNDEFPVNVCGGYSVAAGLLADPLPDFYISQTNLNFTQNNLLQQFRQNLTGGAESVYYFHSDHLGSASWITNNTGLPVQHLQYLPFGEHFVNEQSTGYFERFTFTGKERDAETGYYYHGARFNSSDIGWLSVDPMSDKYPSLTPYNYCAWNPIKLVDPAGREFGDIYNLRGVHIGNDGVDDNKVYLLHTDKNIQLTTAQSKFAVKFTGFVTDVTAETGLTNDELNLRASLSTLKQAEAGKSNPPLDYNSWNNNVNFTEDSYENNPQAYAKHPGLLQQNKGNLIIRSSAAGAYQFLKRYYTQKDFSPQSQDREAVNLMTYNGYEAALSGNMSDFISNNNNNWTSLNHWSSGDLQKVFNSYRAKELLGISNIATPIGNLLRK